MISHENDITITPSFSFSRYSTTARMDVSLGNLKIEPNESYVDENIDVAQSRESWYAVGRLLVSVLSLTRFKMTDFLLINH